MPGPLPAPEHGPGNEERHQALDRSSGVVHHQSSLKTAIVDKAGDLPEGEKG